MPLKSIGQLSKKGKFIIVPTGEGKDELISDVFLWTATCGHTSVGWPAKTYIHLLCADTWYFLEDLQSLMAESVLGICAIGMPWWWLINPSIYLKKENFYENQELKGQTGKRRGS